MEIREATPSSEETIVYKLQTSDDPNPKDDEIIITSDTIIESREGGYEKMEIKVTKSTDVDKNKKIRLNEETLFQFDCSEDDECLTLKLSEIDAVAPFIYIKKITLKELQTEVHKMFKALDKLKEAKEHIEKLFIDGRIKLRQEKEEEIFFDITAYYISEEVTFSIILEREMTKYKDQMLLKLYEIQKQQLKKIKEIEKSAKK